MPDSGNALAPLYPQPPTNGIGSLSPAQIIGTAQGLQTLEASRFDLQQKQNQFLMDYFGSFADKPNLSKQDLIGAAVTVGRNFPNLPSAMINTYVNTLPDDPKQLRGRLDDLSRMVRGAEGLARPDTTGYGPGGAPISGTSGQATTLRRMGAPAAPGGTISPAPVAAPGAPGISAPPPGQVGAETTAGEASGKAYSDARDAAGMYRRQVYPLEKAIPALEKLGTTGTGPGTETLNDLWSFAQSMGLPVSQKTGDTIKDYDTARKYLTDWVMQNGNTATNDKLVASFASNPNVHISNAGAVELSKAALALRRMQHAQFREFQETGQTKDQYADWLAQHSANVDPRYYAIDQMSPAQRNALYNENKTKFRNTYTQAEHYGIYGVGPHGYQ